MLKKIATLVFALSTCHMVFAVADSDMSSTAIQQRIQPVSSVATEAPAQTTNETTSNSTAAQTNESKTNNTSQNTAATGEKVYQTYCTACHSTGAAGAPKLGDAAAWKPRIAQGINVLIEHATQGYKMMPPKGTCINCSNDDIAAAVNYMVSAAQK